MRLLRFASNWVEWLQPELSFKTTLTNMKKAHTHKYGFKYIEIQIWKSAQKQGYKYG